MIAKPKLAVVKFASCDGCQLALLSIEDQLLALADRLEIAYFLEASSRMDLGPYDLTLVEGSITTQHDIERLQEIRRRSRFLMTIGACATAGGIQALKNWGEHREFLQAVYAKPEFISTLSHSTPIASHVPVDYELRGCPINHRQLLTVIADFLAGRQPRLPRHTVCQECKVRGNVCVMVAQHRPCLGPVTHAGCGAICPAFDRGCYGCYGPAAQANLVALTSAIIAAGTPRDEVIRSLRGFNGYADAFRRESDRLSET